MGGLMQNPDMLKMALNMMKDPNNKEMLSMMGGGNVSATNMGRLVKVFEVFVWMATGYKKMKQAYENKFVKLFLFAFLVIIVAYYFSWAHT